MSIIEWPAGHEVAGAAIHETNVGVSRAAPEAVWAWLVRPDRWGDYYGNAWLVRSCGGRWPEVTLGSRFSWVTFGAPVTTEITEYEPLRRLAWTGSGLGSRGHHAWVLTARTDGGTDIRTEETQRGAASKLLSPVLAPAMRRMHQRWVDNLARIAESGRRP
ncbi:SRPBCC domain-containing protein [Mycobacterium simiae]|uniref:SRPBCC domain-containing protein n=1 Tax=Mycobacterium simiae TaxID=1784 RepID=UPI00261E2BC1|nr:SRPBCC domain-containing protein [Mycobacterium simiae]